jgi:hypothetical protein
MRNTKVREELNNFYVSNRILKQRSQWKYRAPLMKDRRIAKKILHIQPKKRRNIGGPQSRWRDQHTFQEDGTGKAWLNP